MIQGRHLGLDVSAIEVTYAGGSTGLPTRSYVATGCRFVSNMPSVVSCLSAAGVGANYRLVVRAGTGASTPSTDTLSYAQPVLLYVEPPPPGGFPTRGGVNVTFHGLNFGALGSIVTAVGTPSSVAPGVEVTTSNCSVVTAHTVVTCTLGPGVSAVVTWQLMVEGQVNTLPYSSFARPAVDRAWLEDRAGSVLDAAATTGGTFLVVHGTNFGPDASLVSVAVIPRGSGSTITTEACAMVHADMRLRSVLPAGVGTISAVVVNVGGQSGTRTLLDLISLRYASPTVTHVTPRSGQWSTRLSSMEVAMTGTGFGPPSRSPPVLVAMSSRGSCDSVPVMLLGRDVVVVNDTLLTFRLPPDSEVHVPHVVPMWTIRVNVSDQAVEVSGLATQSPSVPALSLFQAFNGTHWFVALTGSQYGGVVDAECPGDIRVSIDGHHCDELRMTSVSVPVCAAAVVGSSLYTWLHHGFITASRDFFPA